MFDEGHAVGLHTHTRHLMVMTPNQVANTLIAAADRIERLAGQRPCRAFRPHGGWRSGQMYAGLAEIDYALVGWGWGLWDFNWYRRPDATTLANRLAAKVSDGDIIVIHDGHHQDPRADREYAVEDGVIVSAGYLVRQADLVAGKSFHGLSLRELDLPPAHYLTVDLVEGAPADANLHLWLWHLRPQHGPARHMLSAGELPVVESLQPRFSVYACEEAPNYFCPRMGRHHTDLSKPGGRPQTATGDNGVIYGEAAGKLIFIEYTFAQKDLEAGVSWPAMPLDGLPIPRIDNVHLLHYEGADGTPGRYTVHMYFIPEETYLAWDREPPRL